MANARFIGTKKEFLAYMDSIGTPTIEREPNVEQLLEHIEELKAERDYWREEAFRAQLES